MEKLAQTSTNRVICELSAAEFKGLAKVDNVGDVADGVSVSLVWIQTMAQRLSDAKLDAVIAAIDNLKSAVEDIKGP